RRFIDDGHLPPRDSVRLEEYVNSFDYSYEPPSDGVFAIHVDGSTTPFTASRSVLVRIGIQAMTVADEARSPVSLTFVVDTSGSLEMDNRLELVKDALTILVGELGAHDSVAIVEFGSDARVALQPTSAAEPDAIIEAIGRLVPGGSTNAQAGLELGYQMAELGQRAGAIDRVVLASDGVANVGLTDADSILRLIEREVAAGIELVTVGVGMGNFNDVLLEQLANHGNGFYAYVNDVGEAERLFRRDLTGTLQTVARDAKVQVEFRPQSVARYRLLGYENRSLADDDFRNPEVDAGEVGAGHSVTALYELELHAGRDGYLGTVNLRWSDDQTRQEQKLARDIKVLDLAPEFESADASFRLAATAAAFAEILRESPHRADFSLTDVAHQADALARWFDDREDVAEFRRLTERAVRLAGR
ncbi:MAG: von Willebrand factor type A domain-containing protein, partial [Chloroflexota bacterium]|nr:von Willebrand factor type A domain-containing protein [Chloroflexota bacterium]